MPNDASVATVLSCRRIAELCHTGREPTRRPGVPCTWCPLADDCQPGRSWLDDGFHPLSNDTPADDPATTVMLAGAAYDAESTCPADAT